MMRRLAVVMLLLVPGGVWAQGSLGNQGFGYPMGGLSSAAASLAGANAEVDPNSSINPAAVTRTNRFSVMLRFEPEFRETTVGAVSSNSSVMRFPTFQATGGMGRWVGAAGVSTMLDRTWRNQFVDTISIGGDPTESQLQIGSEGAMSDARVAVGYVVNPRLQLGVAFHALTGENRTLFLRRFDPTSGVSAISQSNSFGFTGTAYSLGVVAEPVSDLLVAASARFGREMSVELFGNELNTAKVPSRFGLGLTYFGIAGLSVYGRVDQTNWTDMEGLARDSIGITDAIELSTGVEALGPKLFGTNTALRAGFRSRTLPFGVGGNTVNESGYAFGIGLPLSRGRGQIDIGAQRLTRTVPGAEEQAWHLSLGFGIRP